MKKFIFILIAILIISCKKSQTNSQEKKNETIVNKKDNNSEIEEIAKLYKPEKINTTISGVESDVKKNDYTITLTNSNLLDADLKNAETHAKKIVTIYYKFLVRINTMLNYNKIIVKIIHRNGKIESFKYSKMDILKLTK